MQENVFKARTSYLVKRAEVSPLTTSPTRGPLSRFSPPDLPLLLLFFAQFLLHIFPSPPFINSNKNVKTMFLNTL